MGFQSLFAEAVDRLKQLREQKAMTDTIRRVFATDDGRRLMQYLIKRHCTSLVLQQDPRAAAIQDGARMAVLQLGVTAYGKDRIAEAIRQELIETQGEENNS